MKTALKKGGIRVYFPEFPNHPLNGATFQRCGKYINEYNGLKTRKELSVFEDTEHNRNNPSSHWVENFTISPSDFNTEKVLVKSWFCGEIDEEYYLMK